MAGIAAQTLTITSGQTVSTAFAGGNTVAYGLQLPAAFTGTSITFQVSADKGTTYQALYDSTGSTQVSVSVTQGRSYDLPDALTAWTHFKIVSGSSEGADRALVVVGKTVA